MLVPVIVIDSCHCNSPVSVPVIFCEGQVAGLTVPSDVSLLAKLNVTFVSSSRLYSPTFAFQFRVRQFFDLVIICIQHIEVCTINGYTSGTIKSC